MPWSVLQTGTCRPCWILPGGVYIRLAMVPGGGRNARQGARGRTLELRVPPGTRIYDAEEVLGELLNHGQTLQVAAGGVGGIGNRHDGTGGPGARGQQRTLLMELRLCADVGLLGLPNAGKVFPVASGLGSAPQDCRLSLYHLASTAGLCGNGSPGPDFCWLISRA